MYCMVLPGPTTSSTTTAHIIRTACSIVHHTPQLMKRRRRLSSEPLHGLIPSRDCSSRLVSCAALRAGTIASTGNIDMARAVAEVPCRRWWCLPTSTRCIRSTLRPSCYGTTSCGVLRTASFGSQYHRRRQHHDNRRGAKTAAMQAAAKASTGVPVEWRPTSSQRLPLQV